MATMLNETPKTDGTTTDGPPSSSSVEVPLGGIDRSSSSSAPPVLELTPESLFSWNAPHAFIFSDIRANPDYNAFFNAKEGKQLPPPLDPPLFSTEQEEETVDAQQYSRYGFAMHDQMQKQQQEKLVTEAAQELSQLRIDRRQEVDISNGSVTWNPMARKGPPTQTVPIAITPAAAMNGKANYHTQLHVEKAMLNNMNEAGGKPEGTGMSRSSSSNEVVFSSSPSAQTAFSLADYILKDEESSNTLDIKQIDPHQEYDADYYFASNVPPPHPASHHTNGHHSSSVRMHANTTHLNTLSHTHGHHSHSHTHMTAHHTMSLSTSHHIMDTPSNTSHQPYSYNFPLHYQHANMGHVHPNQQVTNNGNGLMNENNNKSNILCRYYAQGYCSRGDKCFYSHAIGTAIPVQQALQPKDVEQINKSLNQILAEQQEPHKKSEKRKSGDRGKFTRNAIPPVGLSSIIPAPQPQMPSPLNLPTPQPAVIVAPTPVPVSAVSPLLVASPSPTASPSNGHISPIPTSPKGPGSPNDDSSPRPDYYNNFDQLIGKIYLVSKDQQGCRFLQKKLEEQDVKAVEIIFREVYDHITELMTDPFGNYLCQKLIEHCNDSQRCMIVERVAPDLVGISKNMHGTRAVQKMIECLSSPKQIEIVKNALADSVVELIQDLNGNHVIQRCLHRLSAEDNNQFIYNAVTTGNNCVQVATHRHGCCVLQRCIDNASHKQKVQLINEIIKNALTLVQDPYGNYVVQYVLDLPFPNLVEALVQSFLGHIRQLAMQKFSSNVIEKSLNVTGQYTRNLIIKEVLSDSGLSAMLQDPFANYVIQTALTVSEPAQHNELIEAIKPHLNQLRNTPYGKRIQNKITKETAEKPGHKHK